MIVKQAGEEVASKVARRPSQQNINIGAFANGAEWCCELKIFGELRFLIPVDDIDRAAVLKNSCHSTESA